MRWAEAELLEQIVRERIVVLDGAMGTLIQRYELDEAGFRGDRFSDHTHDLRGANEVLNLTRPEIIGEIHGKYLDAGADIISTNTFNANAISLADYGARALRARRSTAQLPRSRARQRTQPPTARQTSHASSPVRSGRPTGPPRSRPTSTIPARATSPGTSWSTAYVEAARGLVDGGVDILLIETIFDTLNGKAAIFAVESLLEELGFRLPVIVSGTITDQSRPDAVGPDRRCLLEQRPPCPTVRGRAQLLARRANAAAVRRRAGAHRRRSGHHLPQRRPAQRIRRL